MNACCQDMLLFNCFALNFLVLTTTLKSSMEMLPANYKKCMIQRSPQDRSEMNWGVKKQSKVLTTVG
jgi:hypothetical protein